MTPPSEAARKAALSIRNSTPCKLADLRLDDAIEDIQDAIDQECAARDALIVELKKALEHADQHHVQDFGGDSIINAAIAKTPADTQGKVVVDSDELAELRKDRERLDWIELKPHWWAPRRHIDGYEYISRAAIDAARAATKEQWRNDR